MWCTKQQPRTYYPGPRGFSFFFFFRERESEQRSGDNEENISELWKTETRVGSEGLQTVRNLRNDGDDRTSVKFPDLVELYHS